MSRLGFLLAVVAIGSIPLTPSAAVAGILPGRLAVGDSVMLAAKDELVARGFRVERHRLPPVPRRGPAPRAAEGGGEAPPESGHPSGQQRDLDRGGDCTRISEIAGANRTVYLVNLKIPRWYRSFQNQRLAACAERRVNTVLVDWFLSSRDHPSWFAADGFHLTPTGQARYAAFLATTSV